MDPPSNFRGDVVTLTLYVTKVIHNRGMHMVKYPLWLIVLKHLEGYIGVVYIDVVANHGCNIGL